MKPIEKIIHKEIKEYKSFALNQSMVQVTVGLLLAAAFQKVVSGISDFLIMPIMNYFIAGDGNWRNWVIHPATGMNIEIGHLIGCLTDFLILTVVLYFLWIKIIIKFCAPDPKKEKPLGVEVVYLKRNEDGEWKVL